MYLKCCSKTSLRKTLSEYKISYQKNLCKYLRRKICKIIVESRRVVMPKHVYAHEGLPEL